MDEQTANALNNDAAKNQAQADQHFQQSTNEPLRTSINSENDEFFHAVWDVMASAWHNLTAKTDRTAAALVKNDPNPGVSAKTALISSTYAVADSDPVGSNLYKAGEGFSGNSYFEPSTGKLQLDTPQQAAGHLETAGLSFGLELGTAYLGGEMLSALKGPAGKGLIYQRTDMNGEIQPYIGQVESLEHFDARVYDHSTTYPNADFKYEFLQEGITPGIKLDVAEETWIRNMGGADKFEKSRRHIVQQTCSNE